MRYIHKQVAFKLATWEKTKYIRKCQLLASSLPLKKPFSRDAKRKKEKKSDLRGVLGFTLYDTQND